VSTQWHSVYIYKTHETRVIGKSWYHVIHIKRIHSHCICRKTRKKTKTHINEMSAIHVSLLQDSHLYNSCRGITHIASQSVHNQNVICSYTHVVDDKTRKGKSFLFCKATCHS
jgi:hypothetical protein